jgi:hypothetical protein
MAERSGGCAPRWPRLFEPEYVNIFGVPFTFLPHEGGEGTPPPPPGHKTQIEPAAQKRQYEITWPNVIRIDHVYTPILRLDPEKVPVLEIKALDTATLAQLAPVIEGKPDVTRIADIDLMAMGRKFRMQKIVFETARDIYDQIKPAWKGNREFLLAQLSSYRMLLPRHVKLRVPLIRARRSGADSLSAAAFTAPKPNPRRIPQLVAGTRLAKSFHFADNWPPDDPHVPARGATPLPPSVCANHAHHTRQQ